MNNLGCLVFRCCPYWSIEKKFCIKESKSEREADEFIQKVTDFFKGEGFQDEDFGE